MKNKIKYVEDCLNKAHGTIYIYTGKLSQAEINKLSKHFRVTLEPLGYTKFETLK